MAKSNNFQKNTKRTNRDLMRQIHLVISSHNAEAADPEAWDAFEPEEPIQRTNYDLID